MLGKGLAQTVGANQQVIHTHYRTRRLATLDLEFKNKQSKNNNNNKKKQAVASTRFIL